jgi:anti-sigma B factor antagonist
VTLKSVPQRSKPVALKITKHNVDGVAVVALDGRVVLGEESSELRNTVKGLLAESQKKIVLDVGRVGFIDSSGLGTLVAVYHTAKAQGATLALCQLGSKFEELLQMTRLLTVFDSYKTEADAVKALAK